MAVRDPADWQLHLMIDDGTSKATVGYQIIRKGRKPEPSNTSTLPLQGVSAPEVPQLIGITQDREVIWGHQLESLLFDHTLQPSDVYVFSHLKVLLFPSTDVDELETVILEQLEALPGADMSMQDLQRLRLAKLRENILEAVVKVVQQFSWSAAHVENMLTYTQVAVPEMANLDQRKAFQTILREAGFRNVNLVSEAEAAAVWRSWKCHEYYAGGNHLIPVDIQAAHDVIVLDAGGYTAHGVRTRCTGFGKDSGGFTFDEPQLQNRIGTSYGSTPCIEERLFQTAMQRLDQRFGSTETALKEELGMTRAAFRRLLNRGFEPYKKSFSTPYEQAYIMSILGTNLQGRRIDFRLEVQATTVQLWYDEAWSKIRDNIIEKLLTPSVKMLMVAGGFFRNPYLHRKLEAYAEEKGLDMGPDWSEARGHSDLSVVLGGMSMARQIAGSSTQAPAGFVLGIDQEEPYDDDIHTDVDGDSHLIIEYMGPDGVEREIVEGRWCKLFDQADISKARTKLVGRIPLEFILTKDDDGIRKTFYYTTTLEIADHEPVWEDGHLREGIQEWQTVVKPISFGEMKEYDKIPPVGARRKGNVTRYVVWAWLKLERSGPGALDIQLSWELAPPGWKPNKEGNIRKDDVGVKPLPADLLHNSQFSPFLQRNNVAEPTNARLPFRSESNSGVPTGNSRKKGPQYEESFDSDVEIGQEENESDYARDSGGASKRRGKAGGASARGTKRR